MVQIWERPYLFRECDRVHDFVYQANLVIWELSRNEISIAWEQCIESINHNVMLDKIVTCNFYEIAWSSFLFFKKI
jgi:hypothetical protein